MSVRVAFLQHSEWDVPGNLAARAGQLGLTTATYRADRGPGGLPRIGSFELLVVMGSSQSAADPSVPWVAPERDLVAAAVAAGRPVLGVCFGGQLLAQVLGGGVRKALRPEIGWRTLDTDDPDRVPPGPWVVWHEDEFSAPPGAEPVARTAACLHAFVLGAHTGVQFHPEVDRAIVVHWADEAVGDGRIDGATAQGLLAGFDTDGTGPAAQARTLFDRFVERSGVIL